jgi:ATP-dependent Clp protease ATP-binding subunit ClpB
MITTERLQSFRTPEFPFTTILLDEIEKASDALWNLLLGILDKGTLTLGTNEQVDLTKTIIVMTSNVGSKELAAKAGDSAILGFLPPEIPEVPTERLKEISISAAKRQFMPEFLNRLDQIVMFNVLTRDNIGEILQLELTKLQANVVTNAKTHVGIIVTPAAKDQIISEGYDRKYGARYLKRAIEKRVSLPVTRFISTRQVEDCDKIIVDYINEDFSYSREST